MNKKILIGSIIAVSILVGVSLTSVVGYRNSESSTINEELISSVKPQFGIERHYKVIGFGNIYELFVNNVPINLRGYIYADLTITNWKSLPPG